MTARRRWTAAAGAGLLVAALAGCASAGVHEAGGSRPTGPDQATVVCAQQAAAQPVDLPEGFPEDFPLPPGTKLYNVDDRGADGIVVTGVTDKPFPRVLNALNTQLPARGFTLEDGETEPHDAESDWTAPGYTGRWAIRELSDCSGDTLVNVVARSGPAG